LDSRHKMRTRWETMTTHVVVGEALTLKELLEHIGEAITCQHEATLAKGLRRPCIVSGEHCPIPLLRAPLQRPVAVDLRLGPRHALLSRPLVKLFVGELGELRSSMGRPQPERRRGIAHRLKPF